jgi:hypothetical protein
VTPLPALTHVLSLRVDLHPLLHLPARPRHRWPSVRALTSPSAPWIRPVPRHGQQTSRTSSPPATPSPRRPCSLSPTEPTPAHPAGPTPALRRAAAATSLSAADGSTSSHSRLASSPPTPTPLYPVEGSLRDAVESELEGYVLCGGWSRRTPTHQWLVVAGGRRAGDVVVTAR